MTKKNFLLIAITCGIFQITALDYFKVFGVKPDFLLLSVISAGIFFEFKWAVTFGIFAGLFKDILGANTFAINSVLFPAWSFLIIKLSREISIDNNCIFAGIVFMVVIMNSIITRLILFYFGNFISLGVFLRITFIEALYSAFLAFFIFKRMQVGF